MTLFDALNSLYEKYGHYLEANQELYMHGIDGLEKMTKLMDALRNNLPEEIAGNKVVEFGDYLNSTIYNTVTGEEAPSGLPSSNVVSYRMENGDVVIARPSGTEPKIKFYYLLTGSSPSEMQINLEKYKEYINSFIE